MFVDQMGEIQYTRFSSNAMRLCDFCQNGSRECHTLFRGINECLPVFYAVLPAVDKIQYRNVHKNLLRDCVFHENQHSE